MLSVLVSALCFILVGLVFWENSMRWTGSKSWRWIFLSAGRGLIRDLGLHVMYFLQGFNLQWNDFYCQGASSNVVVQASTMYSGNDI